MTALPIRNSSGDRGWMQDAACRDQPSRWFTDPANTTDVAQALATCKTCAVRTPCLTTALSHHETGDVGIWGGTTPPTRRRIRTGTLDIADVLDPHPRHAPATSARPPTLAATPQTRTEADRLSEPKLPVARTASATYESADGRTVIFRIHGDPPWMLMIDDHPIARTDTLVNARRLAWTAQHGADTRSPAERLDIARGR